MDEEEKEFNERIKKIHDARDEENQKLQKLMLSRVDDLAISKEFQDEQMKFFEDEKDKLTTLHEKEITKKRQDYWADLVKLERNLDNELEEVRKKVQTNLIGKSSEIAGKSSKVAFLKGESSKVTSTPIGFGTIDFGKIFGPKDAHVDGD
ncbi:hypothetical protein COLO4_08999 [Corchorus olitorius]|uniref:Uncharacterized protein n=1 Tax=Corchorus olitorius TaxID=93759 RepID=A0A1R3KDL5_9ROSI|nr:hypothetical protein COLO4_08999 [Corchorus olitorius]